MDTRSDVRERRGQAGFTLIELLVVIVILGILSGVVVFAVRGIAGRGRDQAVAIDARTLRTALETYCASKGTYPADPGPTSTGYRDAMDILVEEKFLSNRSGYNIVTTADGLPEGNCPGTPRHFKLTQINDPGAPPPQGGNGIADFDGDSKTDVSVYRPSSGQWFLRRSTAGESSTDFGANGDLPLPLPAAIRQAYF